MRQNWVWKKIITNFRTGTDFRHVSQPPIWQCPKENILGRCSLISLTNIIIIINIITCRTGTEF